MTRWAIHVSAPMLMLSIVAAKVNIPVPYGESCHHLHSTIIGTAKQIRVCLCQDLLDTTFPGRGTAAAL